MSEVFINFINLFIIPMITLCILLKDVNLKEITKFDYVSKYCNSVVFNLLLTKGMTYLIKYLFNKVITTYSFYYTIIGVFIAIAMALIAKTTKIKYVERKQDKEQKQMKEQKEGVDEDKKA